MVSELCVIELSCAPQRQRSVFLRDVNQFKRLNEIPLICHGKCFFIVQLLARLVFSLDKTLHVFTSKEFLQMRVFTGPEQKKTETQWCVIDCYLIYFLRNSVEKREREEEHQHAASLVLRLTDRLYNVARIPVKTCGSKDNEERLLHKCLWCDSVAWAARWNSTFWTSTVTNIKPAMLLSARFALTTWFSLNDVLLLFVYKLATCWFEDFYCSMISACEEKNENHASETGEMLNWFSVSEIVLQMP